MTAAKQTFSLRTKIWGLWAAAMMLVIATFIMIIFGGEAVYTGWGFRGFPSLLSIPFSIMGLLILRRYPRHGMGWVLLGIGLFAATQGIIFEYMLYSLVLFPEQLPGGLFVAWFLNSYWVFLLAAITMMLVLFPTGRLPSPRWRIFIWTMMLASVLLWALNNFVPAPLDSSFAILENPYGIQALEPLRDWTDIFAALVLFYFFGPPVFSLIGRFRKTQGAERQQYKWFGFAATLIMVGGIFTGPSENPYLQLLFILFMFFLPVALSIAILRHNLFDIDIIIRRTLVYTVLTALLVGIYFGTVVLLQTAVGRVTNEQSPLIIVFSTLLIAALFNPLRHRVQALIDRRFYRSKYDAAQTLAEFAEVARDEVELGRLTAELLRVSAKTMQPGHISLWIKPDLEP